MTAAQFITALQMKKLQEHREERLEEPLLGRFITARQLKQVKLTE